MTYSSTVYRLLISAPGDVPAEDRAGVVDAINRWNVIYGQQFGAVVVPVHWASHAAAEHGDRPQASLNDQLVESADVVIALFWHRLGSATGVAASGTVEEIEEAHDRGAYVAILRCERDYPQSADPDQIIKLREFYDSVRGRSLMLTYANDASLAGQVDAILTRAVTRDGARAEVAAESPARAAADVWPRVESREHVETDSRGRAKTSRRWAIVLANTGGEPARLVRHRLEPENEGDDLPFELDGDGELEVLAPRGEARYSLALHMGVAAQARCVVTWQDDAGEHENRSTLRFF
jgi:hypothetical protein